MKKIKILFITILIIICSQSFSYADNTTWVKDAFQASDTFLKEKCKTFTLKKQLKDLENFWI